MDSMLLQNFRCNSPDAKFSCRITQFHLCVRCRSLLLPLPRRTLPKRLEEVEESVKVLKDASKTRKVAAEKVLSALSVIEKAKIDPSGFLETLVGNESPGRTWMLIFTAEFENLKWSSELVSLERPDSWLEKVKTALIDMYAKCGSVRVAHALFEMLREERVVSWNAIITGYAMHGLAKEALELFEVMRKEARPDLITFVGVLAACSRGLLLNEGQAFYDMMMRDYGINPTVQHYTCMEVMGQEFSHEGVNSEHTSYDQYEQEEEKYEEVDVDYMDENDTSVEPMFDYHGFDEGVRDGVQVDNSGAGLATNDLGHSMPRDPRKCRTKGGLHSPIKENIDVDSVAWRATIEQLVVFVVASHSQKAGEMTHLIMTRMIT
ncbi:hypothetical protein HN873_004476 [Arachis hypogaea]